MDEKFLQFIWQQQLFDKTKLISEEGEKIIILHQGFINSDSGPDFFNAKIQIGNQIWAGNVEIHVKSSDWIKHKHHLDSAYDNVILHVVGENDIDVKTSKGIKLPSMILKYENQLYKNYVNLILNKGPIPCSHFFEQIDVFYIKSWENRLLVERFERKSTEVIKELKLNDSSWEETFYRYLAKNFGFKTNSLPFELLAKSTPLKAIYKQKDNLTQIEALLFGQAGFLDISCNDEYYIILKREYNYLSQKYNLKKINNKIWKFLRLRPVNFPTIRIAQFAAILFKNYNMFYQIIEQEDVKQIKSIFDVNVSSYWKNHFQFCKNSVIKEKKIGKDSIDGILINTVALFLFAYGKVNEEDIYKERALNLLETIKKEKNSIIQKWEESKIYPENAFESQSLIELYNQYCKKGRCLDCSIGAKIVIHEKYQNF